MSTATGRRKSGAGSKAEKASRKRAAEAVEEPEDKENSSPPAPAPKGKSPKKSPAVEKESIDPASENEEPSGEKASPAKKAPAPKAGKKGKKRKSSEGAASTISEDSLYARLKRGTAMKAVITDWFKAYDDKPAEAVLDLVNLVVQASGQTKAVVDIDTFNEGDMAEVLKNLVAPDQHKAFREEGGDYPVASRKKENRKFTKHFLEFWEKLVTASYANGTIFDGYLADTLVSWMTAISSSSVRPFRHTATLAGLEIVKALIGSASEVRKENDTLEDQLQAEKKKKGNVAPLNDRLKKSQTQLTTLEQLVQELYNGIFVHRYRDTVPEIRIACIAALGGWIQSYKALFLADTHLKYVAWMLNDRAAEVREAAIQVLIPLYRDESCRSALGMLTQRFSKRIVQLTRDRETSVAVRALALNEALAENDLLPEEELDEIYVLATDEIAALRAAAARFVAMQLKAEGGSQDATEVLKKLVVFVTKKSQLPDNPTYIVDAIWDELPQLRDFKAMADLLLNDTQAKKRALNDAETTVLVSLLHASVRRALGLNICPKEKPNKPLSEDASEKVKGEIASQLLEAIPQLLKAFQGDADKVAQLAELPQYFALGDYKKGRKEKAFKDLLALMRDIYKKHTSADVLSAISSTFKHLRSSQGLETLFNDVDVAFGKLTEELVAALNKAKTSLVDDEEDDSDDSVQYSLLVTLQRVDALLAQHNLSEDVHETLDSLFLNRAKLGGTHGDEISALTLSLLLKDLTWSVASLREQSPKKAVDAVRLKRDTLINNLDAVLREGTNTAVGTEAFFVLSDVLALFSPALRASDLLRPLAYDAGDDLAQQLVAQFDAMLSDEPTDELVERAVTALSRLISFKLIESPAAASRVVARMVSHGEWITEIVKTMIKRSRENDPSHRREAVIFVDALKAVYERVTGVGKKGKKKQADENAEAFEEFKKLGKALAYTFGVGSDRLKEADRRSLLGVLHAGATYALSSGDHYRFFEGLHLLTSKMPADLATRFITDLQNIVARLDDDSKPNESDEQHQPYFDYVSALEKHAGKAKPVARRLQLDLEVIPATTPRTPAGVEVSVASSAPTSSKKTPSSKGKGKKQKKGNTPALSESERDEPSAQKQSKAAAPAEEEEEEGLIDRRFSPRKAAASSQSQSSQSSQELLGSSKKKPKMSVPAKDINLAESSPAASSGGSGSGKKKRASPAAAETEPAAATSAPKGKKKKK